MRLADCTAALVHRDAEDGETSAQLLEARRLQGQTKRRPVEIGDLKAAISSTRGSGWYVAGIPVAVPRPGSAELPRAARSALKRRWSRAGALPVGHFDHVAAPTSCR